MGYVAIKGGEAAIEEAAKVLEMLRTRGADSGEQPLSLSAIEHQLHFLHGAILSEGGLYDPELASLAVKQSLGDPLEAAFYLRAYRSTRPRRVETPRLESRRMRLLRRISAAFKEVPGGQVLGPTPDYAQRLFDLELIDETPEAFRKVFEQWTSGCDEAAAPGMVAPGAATPEADPPEAFGKVIDVLRAQGLIATPSDSPPEPFDATRQPLVFPLPRSARLALLSRGQTGSVLALAYSNMRGYGDIHPTVAELRVGYIPVELPHPVTGEPVEIGEVLVTECEIVAMYEAGDSATAAEATFGLGYGACFGHNESKAIAMAVLDRALQRGALHGPSHPSEDPEFVLLHIDGVDSMGFCIHYKMPHYVTFQSDLDRLRATRQRADGSRTTGAESS